MCGEKELSSSPSDCVGGDVGLATGGGFPSVVPEAPVVTEFLDPSAALDAFYRDLLHELGEFARRPSATAIGAAVVAKRVALTYGIGSAERLPLPRFSRAEREDQAENEWRKRR